MQAWFPVINHCTSRVDHSSKIGIHCSKTQLPFLMALFMKQVCANTCVYYKVQRFHFGGEYSLPSVTAVQTLLLPSAHSAMSLWKCWLWSVILTKPALPRTFWGSRDNWNSDEWYPVKPGCVFPIVLWENTKLGWILSYILIPPAMKNWCTQCLQGNVLFQAAFGTFLHCQLQS